MRRPLFLLSLLVIVACLASRAALTWAEGADVLAALFRPPAQYADKLGNYRSPLTFDDGTPVKTAADWTRRRAEILQKWHSLMGPWPPLLAKPRVEYLERERRDNFAQHKVRLEVAPGTTRDGYLLIPDGEMRRPAVVVVYYEPETGIGLKGELRDFAYQLAKRGFVALSLGSPPASFYPGKVNAQLQPLSFHAYVAANCYNALANLPQVDGQRIGIVGHSYGGKWAMFASCLFDRFACAAWSDPGIVFDEKRGNVNYWEPWYLGYERDLERKPGIPGATNPRTGPYKRMIEEGRDLHELHALMAPRPFLVSGGAEDQLERWLPLNHTIAVNALLGHTERVAMTNRRTHAPTVESNEQLYGFFERFLKHMPSRFPQASWETRAPHEVGLHASKLDALRDLVGGRGCVVRHGLMAYRWGEVDKGGDVASAVKPVISTLLLLAVQEGRLESVDDKVADNEPPLKELNAGKDSGITWRHLASQTSGYGLVEKPGEAYSYNDFALALYYDTLMQRVFRAHGTNVLRTRLAEPLQFEDSYTFEAFGPNNRPGRLAISVRDFARFGLLILRDGKWNDRQLIRPDLLKLYLNSPIAASTPLTSGKEADMLPRQRSLGGGKSITPVGPGFYSFNWWLNRTDAQGRRLYVDAPPDTSVASGHGGKRTLWIMPSLDLIVAWNDSPIADHDASPGNPNAKCNQAAKLMVESVVGRAPARVSASRPTPSVSRASRPTPSSGANTVINQWLHLSSKSGDLPTPPGSDQQTMCIVCDLDKDGRNDIVIGCRRKGPAMVWLRNTKQGWQTYNIDNATLPIEAGGAFADIDGDGDLDLVAGEDSSGNKLYWWENPCPNFAPDVPWNRREIKSGGARKHHDQIFGDFDGDGKLELAFWNQGANQLLIARIPVAPKLSPWPTSVVWESGTHAEGIGKADLDGDGRIELLAGGRWFKPNVGQAASLTFTPHVIDDAQRNSRIAVGDLNGDGKLEVVMVPGDAVGRLKWYERKDGAWHGHDLLGHDVKHGHSLAMADFDGDGHLDIFCAEMRKWTQADDHADAKMWLFLGDGHGGFTKTEIASGFGVHEARVADLDGDRKLDIVAKAYNWETPRIDVWLNRTRR